MKKTSQERAPPSKAIPLTSRANGPDGSHCRRCRCLSVPKLLLLPYRIRIEEALEFYGDTIYPRHLKSFPLFGIEARGFWTAMADVQPRPFALAPYAAGEEPGEVVRRYMQSNEFAGDIRNFDVSEIMGVESTILTPSTSSPLK